LACREPIVLLTSRAAERVVRHFARQDPCVEVEVLPVNVAAFLTVERIEALLDRDPRLEERLRRARLVVLPGLVRGDASRLSSRLGVPVVKGTRSASGIPALIQHIRRGGSLSPRLPADDLLENRRRPRSPREALRVGPVEVALRGPPVVVAAEVPPGRAGAGAAARTAVGEGASIVVVGASRDMDPGELASRVAEALAAVGGEAAVLAEAPTPRHGLEALGAGAHGLAGSPDVLVGLRGALQGRAALVAERSIDSLLLASEELLASGVAVLADPVLDMPMIGMADSIARFAEAARRLPVPLVFSAANIATEVEADTHGVHALLAALAVELEASVYYVVEERYKDAHSTAEAREALELAERAYEAGLSERGLPSRLLILKQAEPPPPPRLPPGEPVPGGRPPRLDPSGYFLIDVDHERRVIILEFRGRSLFRLESPRALDLAREALRRAEVSLEHAAYLGYELCRAELALRLGRTYIQDEDPIRLPWEG
jgi:dihydropteroate synthase-like protein